MFIDKDWPNNYSTTDVFVVSFKKIRPYVNSIDISSVLYALFNDFGWNYSLVPVTPFTYMD